MFEWFTDLGILGRLGVAGLFLAAAGIAWLSGWYVPWLWAVGGVLLLFALFVSD